MSQRRGSFEESRMRQLPAMLQSYDTTVSSCVLCNELDTSDMVACDCCNKWFHFNCVGVTQAVEHEDWICSTCTTRSSNTAKANHNSSTKDPTQSRSNLLASKNKITPNVRTNVPDHSMDIPTGNNSELTQLNYRAISVNQLNTNSFQSRSTTGSSKARLIPPNTGTDEQRYFELNQQNITINNVSNKSINTSSSRKKLLLKRIEEEKKLAEERDRKYLDQKYAMLDDFTSSSISEENHNVSKSRAEDWVKKQNEMHKVTFANESKDCDSNFGRVLKQSLYNEPVNSYQQHYSDSTRHVSEVKSPINNETFRTSIPKAKNALEDRSHPTPITWIGNPILSSKPATTQPAAHDLDEEQINLTTREIIARQAVSKDLPIFNGDPTEWPIFYSTYLRTTQRCGFTNEENMSRLQRCLKGNALAAVKSKLVLPDTVPQVINTLRMLFGKPEQILRMLTNKIMLEPQVQESKLETLIRFSLSVQNLCDNMIASKMNDHLNNPALLQDLIEKLPTSMRLSWAIYKQTSSVSNLATFNDWLLQLAEAASSVTTVNIPLFGDQEKKGTNTESNKPYRVKGYTNAHVEENSESKSDAKLSASTEKGREPKCNKCGNLGHFITDCKKFVELNMSERWKLVNDERLCRRCLGKNHYTIRCRRRQLCGINGCEFKHHPLLHDTNQHINRNIPKCEVPTERTNTVSLHRPLWNGVLFRVVPIKLYGAKCSITTFAFLDEGSSITLLDENIAKSLELGGPVESLCLRWTGDTTRQEKSSRRVSLEISGVQPSATRYRISDVRTVKNLNLPSQSLTYDAESTELHHLKGLPVQGYENANPGILIGLQHWKLGLPLEIREGQGAEPIAAKTRLGWTIFGHYSNENMSAQVHSHYHICHCQGDKSLHQQVKEYFTTENFGVKAPMEFIESKDDQRARDILQNTTRYKNGRYETALLWRYDDVQLPDSLYLAKSRFSCLERKMKLNPKYAEHLKKQMEDYLAKGYVRKLSKQEADTVGPRTWYLPIFTVTNPNKPGKVRFVWDAAAKVNDISLNSMLLKGPDLLSSLVDVLFRFRERKVAISGDIKEMFHQVKVTEKDQDSQRFLWQNENLGQEPDVYVMTVMTFGAACSPCIAQYVKNSNAMQFSKRYPRATQAIVKNHYVDDWLDSFDSVEEAISVIQNTKIIHSHGGFEIRNWQSNIDNVLKTIGAQNGNTQKNLNGNDESATTKVLGMWWDTTSDVFYFSMNLSKMSAEILNGSRRPTKREVLKTLMMIFDPLGLVAFFLVYAKILLQEIWRASIDWDETITENQYTKWLKWVETMPIIEDLKIPRCYLDNTSARPKSIELHLFVDASENAFAAVGYFRFITEDGIKTALVAAKTKVAPQQPLSIPRLELQAAVLGARLANTIEKSHSILISKRTFWSDSATVLCWLRSDQRIYRQFVAFRVGEILETTNVNEWRWVPTKHNVADEATKWKDGLNISSSSRWFSGPEFLLSPEDQWPRERVQKNTTDEELRIQLSHIEGKVVVNSGNVTPDPYRFSRWRKMVRAQAYVLRIFNQPKPGKIRKKVVLSGEEEAQAENEIIRAVQQNVYQDEIYKLRKNSSATISKNSTIHKLSPFLDTNMILRMRSRLTNAENTNYDMKYPIILPTKHRVTELIAESKHRKYLHQNFETVINELRQNFVISKIRVLLKKVVANCLVCRIKNAKPSTPEMADLPRARLAAFERPFSHVGIDLFGPIDVAVGRRTEKRWGMIFTCLTIRALHLEIVHSLSLDSCIMGIRNFIARRGTPLEIYSDNGTNFRGADKELRRFIEGTLPDGVQEEFAIVKWNFIPPASPHMGGCWERLVRSVKQGLKSILPSRKPSDELLKTCFLEVENIINSRPLTFVSVDPNEQEALTPNHYLLGSSSGIKPAGKFDDGVLSLRKNWQISQRLTQLFWKRWVNEYMPIIARRTKWHEKTKPIEIGDFVIIMDENIPNSWKKGIVIDVATGSGGQVRQVTAKTSTGIYVRPAVKVAVLNIAPTSVDGKQNSNIIRHTGAENVIDSSEL